MGTAIKLGPFELHEVVGRGGMGDVWRARHSTQGLDVALKVVTSSRAQNPRALAAFRNEVHSMARLSHPGIVVVFDVGEVTAEAAEASAGILRENNPVLAMEYATHGTLNRVRDGLHWRRLRAVLLSILDALAHAHARGVVHRDLKPGNVLVTNDFRGRPVLKLADFGLAQALYRPDPNIDERKVSGTPKYMAPEQIEGRLRDQGPWTDLYALGCLAYWMLTGSAPFDGEVESVLAGHLFDAPPPVTTEIDLPPGFEDWIMRLLAKSPRERFRCAADAAWGLMLLDDESLPDDLSEIGDGLQKEITDAKWTEPELSVIDETIVVDPQAPTSPGGSRRSRPLDGYSATIMELPALEGASTDFALLPKTTRPPLPADWRRARARPRSMRVIGAGLGLYGLRPIPLVGRDNERTEMWAAMRDVHEQHDVRAIVVSGATGAGKSRLAEWLCERLHEVGGAATLRAFHGPDAGPGYGLGRMLADHLRCVGLAHQEVIDRVRNAYFASGAVDGQDLYDARAIAEMIVPNPADGDETIRFSSPTERYIVITRFLARQVADRPLVIWLDDVQWGLDALDFLVFVLSTGRQLPVLFVLTTTAETQRTVESQRLDELLADGRTMRVDVDRLDWADHERLVAELLSLEPDLAREVAERTDGNPLFAVQLVGDWVQRGLLVVREDGFALAEEGAATLPDSIHELWLERIDGFVARQPSPEIARRHIELAAVLGPQVDAAEWVEACGYLEDSGAPNHQLVERLVHDGLVLRRRAGFAFSHRMLQESLVRVAQERFRIAPYHRAAARMLTERYSTVLPESQERLGTHLQGAGEWESALEPLLRAATAFGDQSDFERAKRAIALRDLALDALGADENDERRGRGWHITIRCDLRAGRVDDAADLIERGIGAARNGDWTDMVPEFELHMGSLARKRGQTDQALEGYRVALAKFEEAGDEAGIAKGLYGIGEVLLYRGDVDIAIEHFEKSLAHTKSEDVGVVVTAAASALIRQDRFGEAREKLGIAIDAFRRVGNRGGRAAALNMLGELERARDELVPAEAAYREALAVLESIGSRGSTIPLLNLGLVYLARKKWQSAYDTFSSGLDELVASGEQSHVGFVHLALCCACGGLGDWSGFDEHLDDARQLLAESAWVDRDIADHADLAARLAADANELDRSIEATALAVAQRDALSD